MSDAYKVQIIWTASNEMLKNKRYIFKFHSKEVAGFVSRTSKKIVKKNSIAILNIELEEKVHLDLFDSNYYLSQLAIIDPKII